MRRTTLALLVGGGVTVAVAVAAVVGFGGTGSGSATAPPAGGRSVQIVRTDLEDARTVAGLLDFGPAQPIASHAAGTITWLPAAGATLTRGSAVLRADDQPVSLLYGPMPAYRPLTVGVDGPDVQQFEQNLQALGFTGFTVDDQFSAATASAVKRWQAALGSAVPTGVVDPASIVYAAGAIRVKALTARLGDPATGDVLSATGTRKVVSVNADASDHGWATVAAPVTVTLPGGAAVAGTVRSVADTADSGQHTGEGTAVPNPGTGNATVAVTIDIQDQSALGALASTPVDVKYVVQRRSGVLAVPVTALLALAEGGYGLELLADNGSRIVAVTVGLFAGGLVEVSGPDLAPGQRVGLPS